MPRVLTFESGERLVFVSGFRVSTYQMEREAAVL
jgi:hypothetical protein